MNKLLICIVCLTTIAHAFADDKSSEPVSKDFKAKSGVKVNSEQIRLARERRMALTGGFVKKPGTGRGMIAVVNTQTKVPTAKMAWALRSVTRGLRLNISFKEGLLDAKPTASKIKKDGASFAIYVVEGGDWNTALTIAPEDRWAVVDVKSLQKDSPAQSVLEDRTRKEIVRAFGWLCGAANSQMKGSVMSAMPDETYLDKVLLIDYPPDEYARTLDYLKRYGVEPYVETTYRHACQEGWAPTPTNDYQKAIWEKERKLPSNPLKIEFDPQKGK